MTAQVQSEGAKAKPRFPKLALIMAMLAVVAAAWWFGARQRGSEAQLLTDAASSNTAKSLVHLESFVVNLADSNQSAFLKVGIDIGVGEVGNRQIPLDKGSLLLSKVRDVILSVLTTCQSGELLASDGKATLKQRLLEALGQQIPELPVKEIYFTEFLVQR